MQTNVGLSGGLQPVLHQPYDQHPRGPFGVEMAPSLIARANGFSSALWLVLLSKMPDVDGAHGQVLLCPGHQPVEVELAIASRRRLVVTSPVCFQVEARPRVAGAALINVEGAIEAVGLLKGRTYEKLPPQRYQFTAGSILIRKPIADG